MTQRWWDQAGLNFGKEYGREAGQTEELDAEWERGDGGDLVAVGRRVAAK